MTLYVDESDLVVNFYINAGPLASAPYNFIITSQYSKQPITLVASLQDTNDRYSKFEVSFPSGFGDEHKNGIYYYSLTGPASPEPFTNGLVKIITEPGGAMGTVAYDSGVETENREAEVYYRPNY